jgi:ABC-type maltose transport system permease subunit
MQQNTKYTLTVWLQSFSTNGEPITAELMAASVLYTLPAVVLFVLNAAKGRRRAGIGRGEGLTT